MTRRHAGPSPTPARLLPARDYAAIAAATRDLLAACGGGRRAASLTRADEPRLSRYGDRHCHDRWAPVDVIADLEADAGEPIVTRALAALSGHALVPVRAEGAALPARADWIGQLATVAREGGDVVGALGEALADDGEVDAAEASRLRREVREQMDALAVLDALLAEREG
jgi:hypothetical protein